MSLDRRAFLANSSRATVGLSLFGLAGCSTADETAPAVAEKVADPAPDEVPDATPKPSEKPPLFEISLAEWSFHRSLRRSGTMTNMDFAKEASKLGFTGIEYVNSFFKDKAKDAAYIGDLKKVADDNSVQSLIIMCDGEGRLGDPDAGRRQKAVENHYRWVEAAKTLGCHSIRVNAASSGTYEEQMKLAADGLRRLTEFGATHAMNVIVENHGGYSSNGAWLASVMRKVDHPRCGTLPDFGNFKLGGGKEYDRYKGVAELMPYAKAVSAKSHDFDDEGNEIHTDYDRMMGIVLAAGYHGFVGVEYEGRDPDERKGILATKKLLERVRASRSGKKG